MEKSEKTEDDPMGMEQEVHRKKDDPYVNNNAHFVRQCRHVKRLIRRVSLGKSWFENPATRKRVVKVSFTENKTVLSQFTKLTKTVKFTVHGELNIYFSCHGK